jgi:hypothetical protein
MSSRALPEGKADNLIALCEPIVWKMWVPQRHTTLWASTLCYRNSFYLFIISKFIEGCFHGSYRQWRAEREGEDRVIPEAGLIPGHVKSCDGKVELGQVFSESFGFILQPEGLGQL